MATPNVAIRLGTTGRAEVVADLDAIGTAGEASAKRTANAYNRAADDVARAQERMTSQRAKLEAVNLGGGGNGAGGGAASDSNVRPLQLTAAAMERLELRARALVSAIDPAYAAQARFDREMGEAKTLIAANAITLDQYAAKLRVETALLNETGSAHGRAAAGAGAQRFAMQNLSYQVQDTFTQLSMGANAFQVIAVQGGQAAGAFANVGGAAGKVASFMIGPWGLAITAGLLVLGPLVDGLFKMNGELDDAVDGLKKNAAQSALTDRAQASFAETAEGVVDAVRKQNEALGRNLVSQTSVTDAAVRDAKVLRDKEINIRKVTIALLEQAKAEAMQANASSFGAGGGAGAGMAQAIYGQRVKDYEDALKVAKQHLADAETGVRLAQIDQAERAARSAVDPIAAVNQQYDRMADKAKLAAKGNDQLAGSLGKTLTAIEKQRAAALKAEQDRQKNDGVSARQSGREIDLNQAKDIVRDIGGIITSAHRTYEEQARLYALYIAGKGPLAAKPGNSDHEQDRALDIAKSPGMSLGKIRAAFTEQGVQIKQLLDEGNHFHVAWGKATDVAAKTTRDVAKAERERAQGLAELRKMFDPAAEAAENYRLTLAKIAALKLDPATTAKYIEGAREAFVKANAAAFTMPDVEAYRGEQTDLDQQRKSSEEARKRLADRVAEQAAALEYGQREIELAGESDSHRDRELAKLNAILELKREGVDLASAEGQAYLANVDAIEMQHQKLRSLQGDWNELQRFGNQFVDTVFNPENWKNFGDLGKSVLKVIADEFLKLAVLNPIKKLLFGGSEGGGGIFGKLLGSIIGSVGKHATGTEFFGGGATWVGENGPEIVFAPTGSKIASADASRRAALQGGQGINLTYAPKIDARGADAAGIARIERQMAQDKREFSAMVISTVNNARERRIIR